MGRLTRQISPLMVLRGIAALVFATVIKAQSIDDIRQAYLDNDLVGYQAVVDQWVDATRDPLTDSRRGEIDLVGLTYEIYEAFADEYLKTVAQLSGEQRYLLFPTKIHGSWNQVEFEISNFYPRVEVLGYTTLYDDRFAQQIDRFVIYQPIQELYDPKEKPSDSSNPFGDEDEVWNQPKVKAEITKRAEFIEQLLCLHWPMGQFPPTGLRLAFSIEIYIKTRNSAIVVLDQGCTSTFINCERTDGQWRFEWPSQMKSLHCQD